MPTQEAVFQNYARWEIEGQVDLSAAGAVLAIRGDGMTVVKNGTGLYDVTVKGSQGMKLVEILFSDASVQDSALGTVKDAAIKSITQSTTGTTVDDITLTFRTVTAAFADVDEATNALTVSFQAVLRTRKMSNPL